MCPTLPYVLSFFSHIDDATNNVNNIHASVSINVCCHALYQVKGRKKGVNLQQKCSFSQNSDPSVTTYKAYNSLE